MMVSIITIDFTDDRAGGTMAAWTRTCTCSSTWPGSGSTRPRPEPRAGGRPAAPGPAAARRRALPPAPARPGVRVLRGLALGALGRWLRGAGRRAVLTHG